MPILGITGGIATGKSTFTAALARLLDAEVFDADRCARELLTGDPGVREKVLAEFGGGVCAPDGSLDRARLREIVFRDPSRRRALEAILHPIIRERWLAMAEKKRAENRWLLVDIPLLFEVAAEKLFDRTVVVACSGATQQARLEQARHLAPDIANRMIASQLDLKDKIARAGHVVWNDGARARLDDQAALLGGYFVQCYG